MILVICGIIDFIIGFMLAFGFADISQTLIGCLFMHVGIMHVGIIMAFHLERR